MNPTAILLGQVLVISLSGVLSPGPMTAATIAAGVRSRHAGALIAVGHGIIEFPLMIALMFGAGAVLAAHTFQVGVGLAGGLSLLLMGGMTLWGLRRFTPADAKPASAASPLWTGIVLTAANPFFLFWWATVGLAIATKAIGLGVLAFALFAIIHWCCDLFWLEVISFASHHGNHLMGARTQRILLALCGSTMLLFGLWFFRDAAGKLAGR